MSKKKDGKPPSDTPANGDDAARSSDKAERDAEAEHSPEVEAAEAAIRRAEAELKKARDFYHQVRQQATDQLKQVREKTVADLIDGTLELVKKHPGPGVLIAALIGFFLGRLFRR